MPDFQLFRCCLLFGLMMVCLSLVPNSHGESGVPVAVVSSRIQPIYREVEITGTVTSPRVARLSPATEGLIVTLNADEGDHITVGQELLTLDQALAQHELNGARAQVRQAQTALSDARRRLKEAESLRTKGSIAETLIEDIRSEVAQDEAVLARFDAEAARLETVLDRHSLKAPFTGIIGRRFAELGEWVTPGQGVFELVATDQLRLDFAVSEDYLIQVSADTQVDFRLNALPGKRFEGRIKAIVPITDPGARTFLLRVVPESAVTAMMPGLSVTATLRITTDREALVVPRDAILRYPDGRVVVWAVTGSGNDRVANEKLVTIGETFDGRVAILGGLQAGEQVVTEGNEDLQNGQRVRIIPANEVE